MKSNILLWLSWLLATGLGGAFIGYMAAPTDFFWELIASGFVVGIAQWMVLRRYIKSAFWWIFVSGLGWILGIFLLTFISGRGILNPIVESLTSSGMWGVFWLNIVNQPIIFSVFGFAQWLVLRRHFQYAFWWIAATALSGVIRGAIGSYTCAVICQFDRGIISNALGWAASSSITGTVLIWLLSNHRQNPSSD